VSDKMLDILKRRAADAGLSNVTGVRTGGHDIALPDGSADLVLLANVWHEITDHAALLAELRRVLKSAGRVVVIDWPAEETPVGPPMSDRIAEADALSALAAAGFSLTDEPELYPYNYTIVLS
jgi:ubiquinone/menaquinone biosynthesis C-methylase UbiE